MAIDINIPSQVKTFANLAAFPATGSLKTIFIAEDTNKTYRWTGSAYVEISASQAAAWGTITGTLSTQTDLQTSLNAKVTGNTAITGATKTKVTYDSKGLVTAGADATTADIADSLNKRYVTDANLTVIGNTSGTNTGDQTLAGLGGVPTTRTLTINGTTQDLSADRTFTVSTGITIGTTAITSGTVGRVLFEGTGNVVQESSSFTYDDTLKVFTITGTIGSVLQHTALSNYNGLGGFQLNVSDGTERGFFKLNPTTGEVRIGATGSGYFPTFYAQGVEAMRIFASTRNIGINTTTDAGFKLDVNGTARVVTSIEVNGKTLSGGASALANNTAYGQNTLTAINTLGYNTAIGHIALQNNRGEINTALGAYSLNQNSTGSQNVGIGGYAGSSITSGSNNVLIGYNSQLGSGGQSNQIVIGFNATGAGSNTATFGNTSIVDTILRGRINLQQYATGSRPTYVKGALIYDSTLSKLVVGGASGWEVVTSI